MRGDSTFKDLNRNGGIDHYEDWRRNPTTRTRDLVRKDHSRGVPGGKLLWAMPC